MEKVVVLIPCHNEAESIGTVIKNFPYEKAKQLGLNLEVLVINNRSTDETKAVAEATGAKVIDELHKGKGNAMRRGFTSIPKDAKYVVMLDGDNTYAPEEILRVVEPLQSGFCKVVIGSRLSGKVKDGSMSPTSRLGNWFFTHMVRLTYRVSVTDVLTGYFAWTKEAIDGLAPHLKSSGFAIEMEMITKMARMGYEIYSVPVSYHPRIGNSNLRPLYDGARILKMFASSLIWTRPQKTNLQSKDMKEAPSDS